MRKIYIILFVTFLCLTINKTNAQVFTSGFETWTTTAPIKPTDWWGAKTNYSVADSTPQYTSSVHGGSFAIRIRNKTTSSKRLTTQDLSITAGTTYTITFWVRGHGLIRTGLYTGGSGTAAYIYNPTYVTVNSTTWTQQTQTVASDTNSAAAEFILAVKSTVADLEDIQVDDVNITSGVTQTVSIHDIQYATAAPYASSYAGQVVITGGIVTAVYNKGLFVQGGYGPWSGLYVYDSAHIAAAGIARGDSITITGTVSEYLTYTELGSLSGVTKVSSGNILHPAYPVTLVNATTESLEGVLVKLTNMPCVNASGSASYGEWVVYNGTDSTKTGGLLYKYTTAVVGTHYDITGAVYLAYGGVMRVEPRDANDVSISSGITENTQNNISIYPNPANAILNIANIEGVDQIKIANLLGQTISTISVSGNSVALNVNNLKSGIYFVSLLKDNSVIVTRKFIKQ